MDLDGNHYKNRAAMLAAGMTLQQQNDALLDKIAGLKIQIDTASGKAASNGDYSDTEWYHRAKYALRMTQKEHQQVLREIGEQNRNQRASNGSHYETQFIAVCRRRLDPELFADILREVNGDE